MPRILAVEIECTPDQYADLVAQLEQQCIQTVEYGYAKHPSAPTAAEAPTSLVAVRVTPHFGDLLDPELLSLICG